MLKDYVTLAQSKERKGSNFAIWQPCTFSVMNNKRVAVFDPSTGLKSNAALQGMVKFTVIPVTDGAKSSDPLNIREDGGCGLDPDSEFEAADDNPAAVAFGCPDGIQEA